MFDDPELPDFDSMSQEELIEWLEQLANSEGEAAAEFFEDDPGDDGRGEDAPGADALAEDDWSGWMDDTEPIVAADGSLVAPSPTMGDDFEIFEGDLPVDLTLLDEDTAPTAALDWLDQLTHPDGGDKLPDISDYRPPEAPSQDLGDLLNASRNREKLDWLEDLAGEAATTQGPALEDSPASFDAEDDFDDEYEDDETLDDLEDESLYSKNADGAPSALASILDLQDREADKYSTESMAPVPDNLAPSEQSDGDGDGGEERVVLVRADAGSDSLAQALLLGNHRADLEAWYADRLQAIAAPAENSMSAPALPPSPAPSKPPPPGLAAAIYSARGKVEADELPEALLDYETLLRTSAGLDWVVNDMRGLIAQARFRANPSVHRVLGDALMRQGHLSAAIDVYRHALSLL